MCFTYNIHVYSCIYIYIYIYIYGCIILTQPTSSLTPSHNGKKSTTERLPAPDPNRTDCARPVGIARKCDNVTRRGSATSFWIGSKMGPEGDLIIEYQIHVYRHTNSYIHIYIHIYIYIHILNSMCAHTYIYIYVYMYDNVCIYDAIVRGLS